MSRVSFRSMTREEFDRFRDWSVRDYARELLCEGQAESAEAALRAAGSDFQALLPDGLDTAGHELHVIRSDSGEDVGMIWCDLTRSGRAFIAEFVISPPYRRRGYGLAALTELSRALSERGIGEILLHVFEGNSAARRLYERAGFAAVPVDGAEPGSLYMRKKLT